MVAATVAVAVSGCTGSRQPPPDRAKPSIAAPSSIPPDVVRESAMLRCSDNLGAQNPVSSYRVVLGVVALPRADTGPALQTSRDDEAGELRLFAKAGLIIRAGAGFRLSVPPAERGRLAIGWGNSVALSSRLVIPGCHSAEGGRWIGYPGGFFVRSVMCATVDVEAGGRTQPVHIGVGAPCPGQDPPPSPSVS